jgi:diguanylate cyclase (GGDEF)-like protein
VFKKYDFLWRRYSGVVLLWLLGIILSYSAFSTINYYEEQHTSQQLQSSFKDKVTSLTQAISSINKVFLAAKTLLEINNDIHHQDFVTLINKDFLKNTGLRGVQWAPAIAVEKIEYFEKKVRHSGIFDYQIRVMNNEASQCWNSKKKIIYPVLFAEPAEFIGHELGLQLSSSCSIAEGMNKALISRKISTANFYTEQNELGFRLLLPIFSANQTLRGYIVGIVMSNQLIDKLWGGLTNTKDYKISIFASHDRTQKIYDSQWREDCPINCDLTNKRVTLSATIPFANQLWTIEFTQFGYTSHSRFYAYVVAILIFAFTSGISLYIWMYINRVRWADLLVKEKTQTLQYQASHDALTKLLNKHALTLTLEKMTKHAGNNLDYCFSLLFIDLDHFKKVNDTKGHLIGDKLLQQVAQRLQQTAKHDDLLFRFGGDEFAVLLDNSPCQVTINLGAEKILKRLEQVYIIGDNKYHIGASIGVYSSNAAVTSANDVIRNADIAMYEAKRLGRGRVVFYQANMHQSLVLRQAIENELVDAIHRDQLSIYLQPIHDNQHLKGFEALSRWHHPIKGVILPDQFIKVAEETGLIHQFGQWLIESACIQLQTWLLRYSQNNCPYISINVSPIQLSQGEVVEHITRALRKYQVPSKLLAIELTESALINNKVIVKQNLAVLQTLGVKVFLDDFGTGYSSLSLLRDFPIDVLKIDRSFIFDIANKTINQDSKNLIKAMINMAKALNMTVVAEGVEDLTTLAWLNAEGCHLMQGYYYSEPMPLEQLDRYLAKHYCHEKISNTKKIA